MLIEWHQIEHQPSEPDEVDEPAVAANSPDAMARARAVLGWGPK